MVFINVLIVGAAPHFVFPCCLNTPADFRLTRVPGAGRSVSGGAAVGRCGCHVCPGAHRADPRMWDAGVG